MLSMVLVKIVRDPSQHEPTLMLRGRRAHTREPSVAQQFC
jgi:hypothetical protein